MVDAFLKAVRQDEALKSCAQLLLEGDDALAVRNFDNLGWDVG